MADNILLNPGIGGSILATDEINGAHHELVKVEFGNDGEAIPVSEINPLPVTDEVLQMVVADILAKIIAAPSTEAKQDAANSLLNSINVKLINPLPVADNYTAGEVLADQSGAGGVLTFTFANEMDLVWIRSSGADSRADPFGGIPSAGTGIICEDGVPQPITLKATIIKVFSHLLSTVNVWGYRY